MLQYRLGGLILTCSPSLAVSAQHPYRFPDLLAVFYGRNCAYPETASLKKCPLSKKKRQLLRVKTQIKLSQKQAVADSRCSKVQWFKLLRYLPLVNAFLSCQKQEWIGFNYLQPDKVY
ncbi:hypothetical protein CSKR_200451 [Clonorchis sinensis]|uniref:Uncharacterized protein n=1 Tax=Clonorchis sinensis TaxID=79923 RepID=A0A8T1ME54_CLOSI|nr:hypothetical protein CSKR_200451 [Clonorchis sinensis]